MAYVPYHADWKDYPDTTTPVIAAALEYIEGGISDAADVADAAIPKATVDAKGDLLVGTAADTVARTAVGADDEVLAASSAAAGGVLWKKVGNAMVATNAAIEVSKLEAGDNSDVLTTVAGVPTWQPPASAGALTQLYDSGAIGASASNFDVTTGLTGYNHLRVIFMARGTNASDNVNILVRLNNDSGANYDYIAQENFGAWGAGGVSRATGQTSCFVGRVSANSGQTNAAGYADILIPNYELTTFERILATTFVNQDTSGDGLLGGGIAQGIWGSTAAVTRITITPSSGGWAIGSRLLIYGIE